MSGSWVFLLAMIGAAGPAQRTARVDEQGVLVLIESDGAPWGTVVPLTTEWRTIDVPFSRLKFFGHWAHPEGRGAAGDRLRADALEAVNVCLGAWLYGPQASQPHGVELQSIAVTGHHESHE